LSKYDVDRDAHDKPLPTQECVEIAEAIAEKIDPRFKDGDIFDPVETEILVQREVKTCENLRTAQLSRRKMGQ
jgi:hypothetical protein